MIEQLLSGLLIAGISGLAFVAYRHPTGYTRIFPVLYIGSLLAMILCLLWNLAVSLTWTELSRFIPSEVLDSSRKATDSIIVPSFWLLVGYLGFNLYALFLRYLHNVLGSAVSDGRSSPGPSVK